MDTTETRGRGLDLVEIFRVIYLGNVEVPPEKQIGTIKVNDCLNSQYLYNVDEVDMPRSPIQHGDEIILTGPTTIKILGDGIVILDIDLFCGTFKDSIHFANLRPGIEGVPMKKVITSEEGMGEICVLYTVFEDATAAHLEIKLTALESTSDFYGIIGATIEAIQRPQFTTILYMTKPEQKTNMGPWNDDMFPLSRSTVAVREDSCLVLHVNLLSDEDDEILKGSLEFVPKQVRYMEDQKDLVGKKARMNVKVTWKCEALTSHEKDVRDANSFRYFSNWLEKLGLQANRTRFP